MSNIADLIEDYILRRLSTEHNQKVELKRADIADAISCAPSQISYVLNTRFTQEKGFVVESRRGLGGFIRIIKIPIQDLIFREIYNELNDDNTLEDLEKMINYLYRRQVIAKREAAILLQTITTVYPLMEPHERTQFIKSLLRTLVNFS